MTDPLIATADSLTGMRRQNGTEVRPGELYSVTIRATPGPCGACNAVGDRVVDHCHEHGLIRGPICPACNTRDNWAHHAPRWALQCPVCAQSMAVPMALARRVAKLEQKLAAMERLLAARTAGEAEQSLKDQPSPYNRTCGCPPWAGCPDFRS